MPHANQRQDTAQRLMARGFQGFLMRAFGAVDRDIEIVACQESSPLYRRLTFSAPGLLQERDYEASAWLRLWLPAVDGSGREFQRAYTMINIDLQAGRFDIDFLLHDTDGPGSAWARQAKVGDKLAVQYYGGRGFQPPELEPAGWLLVADEASIPAVNEIIATLPQHLPIDLYLHCSEYSYALLPVAEHPQLRVTRVEREADAAALIDAVLEADRGDWYAWVAVEAGATKQLRQALQGVGFPKASLFTQAYWVRGREMGTTRGAEERSTTAKEPRKATRPRERAERSTHTPWRAAAGGRLLRPLRPFLYVAAAVQFVASLLMLLPLAGFAWYGARLLAGAAPDELQRFLLLLAGAALAGSLLASGLLVAAHLIDARFGAQLRTRLVERLSWLPLGWFRDRSVGRVEQAVQADSAALHVLTTHAVPDVVAAAVTPLAVLALLLSVQPVLTLVFLVPLVAWYVATAQMMYATLDDLTTAQNWSARIKTRAAALLGALQVERLYPTDQFRTMLADRVAFFDRWQRPTATLRVQADLAMRPLTILTLFLIIGTPLVALGWLAPAKLFPFLILAPAFGSGLLVLLYSLAALREANAAALRIGLLLEEPTLAPPGSTTPLPQPAGHLEFRNVSFGYHPRQPLITGLDISLRPGTVTALVGPSGAGKSTVAALAARLYEPQQGEVLLDGRPLADYPPGDLGRRVGFIFQQTMILHDSVAANLLLGQPTATREQLEAAIRAVGLDGAIAALPHGLDTVLGAQHQLSGGEAQRLAIARMLLASPQVVVLDEATAYADPESEQLVQRALSRLVHGRTMLVIAHRLGTVANADAIVVMDGGRIVEQGSHERLLAAGGLYAGLWQLGDAEAVA